jgi:hypothetical protein
MAIVMFCGAAWKLQCIKWEYLNDLKYYIRFTWSMITVDSVRHVFIPINRKMQQAVFLNLNLKYYFISRLKFYYFALRFFLESLNLCKSHIRIQNLDT